MGRLTGYFHPISKHTTFTHGVACTRANVEEFCINRNMNLTDDYATVLKKKIADIQVQVFTPYKSGEA